MVEDGSIPRLRHMKVTVKAAEDDPCPVRGILSQVGDKWSVLVILELAKRSPSRFSELKRAVRGISQRMLTETLRHLERNGTVTRTFYPTIPPKVEYALTGVGDSLVKPIRALVAWAEDHRTEITDARNAFDSRKPS
jgi:DNA-binding HxlR family transcriptional regulator